MVAHLERSFAEVLTGLFAAARKFQTACRANRSASPAELTNQAGETHRMVAASLVDRVPPEVRGLSGAQKALYGAALRYGSARPECEPSALRDLIDAALALPP
jgi:hypothetical protein